MNDEANNECTHVSALYVYVSADDANLYVASDVCYVCVCVRITQICMLDRIFNTWVSVYDVDMYVLLGV